MTPEELLEELLATRWPDIEIDWSEVVRTVSTFGNLMQSPVRKKFRKRELAQDESVTEPTVFRPRVDRLDIVRTLLARRPHTTAEITRALGVADNKVSHYYITQAGGKKTGGSFPNFTYTIPPTKSAPPAAAAKPKPKADIFKAGPVQPRIAALLKTGEFTLAEIRSKLGVGREYKNMSAALFRLGARETTGKPSGATGRKYTLKAANE